MSAKEIRNKLAKIGYSTLWLDYGVLTIDYLIEQENIFDNSDDQNTEHYRYSAFQKYLSSKSNLTDSQFDNYLILAFSDIDPSMAGSAAVDLFGKIELTEYQFQKLCNSITHFGVWTERVVNRHTLLRKLKTTKLTNDLFKECIEKGDNVVHEYLLNISNAHQLEELIVKGKNKKIRNFASEKLKRIK